MREKRCENCDFWEEISEEIGGFCRRYAPEPIVRWHSIREDNLDNIAHPEFPRTFSADWCGEFQKTDSIDMDAWEDKPIEVLRLSARPYNCLMENGITTIGELLQKTPSDLLKIRFLGRTSLREVKRMLLDLGLYLNGEGVKK